jgi:hypothetical protein
MPMFIVGNPRLLIEQCKAGAEYIEKLKREYHAAGERLTREA